MDPDKNYIPENVRSIHLIAICGTAMGALASMLKKQGFHVTGSDQKMYPPMSDFLKEQGIGIMDGYSRDNLSHRPDLVIVGNAVSKENPEAVATDEYGICYCSMPQALNHFFTKNKTALVVTGTHGKTTTSSLLAWVLYHAGLDPTFMIGGILKNFDSNYRLGEGDYIVIEGDEYDTAFFDKGAKFLHFKPDITILTSIEFDHADIFRDMDHVVDVFRKYVSGLPSDSSVVACDAYTPIDDVLESCNGTVKRYGMKQNADWLIGPCRVEEGWNVFDVSQNGVDYGPFRSKLPGIHNAMNIVSVIAAAHSLGVSAETIKSALERFQGIRRRQEIRGVRNGITVMDDFAHHPTAVRETIRALKPYYRKGRIIAVFEPRTNTSMRDVFQKSYTKSFDDADLICIRKPPLLEKIPENHRFSSQTLVSDLALRGLSATYFDSTDEIIDHLKTIARKDDLILIMSNGGFDNIHERLLKIL